MSSMIGRWQNHKIQFLGNAMLKLFDGKTSYTLHQPCGFIVSFWVRNTNDRYSEEERGGGGEEDLYTSLRPALCRVLPSLTPETQTDVHDYSLKNLTETVHKWKVSNFTFKAFGSRSRSRRPVGVPDCHTYSTRRAKDALF